MENNNNDITRWEYEYADGKIGDKLQELGKQGWEGFGASNGLVYLKRKLPKDNYERSY